MDTSRKKYDFVYNFTAAGKNITEVINVKERGNQLFKDKFVLVMLVLGLLTIVAAAYYNLRRLSALSIQQQGVGRLHGAHVHLS